MSARRRRRKRGAIGAILADPYRKLAAIALAIGLWHFLDNQVSDEKEIDVALTTDGIPPVQTRDNHRLRVDLGNDDYFGRRFVKGNNDTVEIVKMTLRGPKARLADILSGSSGLEFQVAAGGQDWTESERTVEFKVGDIARLSVIEGLHIEMDPARFRLEVDRRASEARRLNLDLVKLTIPPELVDRAQLEKATFDPPEVTLVGSAKSLSTFRQQLDGGAVPFSAAVSRTPGEREATGKVVLTTDRELRLALREAAVTVKIPLAAESQNLEFDAELLLVIDDKSLPEEWQGKYHPKDDQGSWRVTVRTYGAIRESLMLKSPEAQREWARTYLRLHVFLPPPDPGSAPPSPRFVSPRLELNGVTEGARQGDCELASQVSITLELEE